MLFSIYIFSSLCQPNFAIDTILLPDQYIQKVSASRSSDVWVIEDTSSRNIYRVDKNLSINNHSLSFQALTSNKFTAILNNDTNNTIVGTANDFVFHWNYGNITRLNVLNGLTDSTINAIVGYPKVLYEQDKYITISANTSRSFSTYDYLTFTSGGGNSQIKALELGRFLHNNMTTIVKYGLRTFRANNEDYIGGNDGSSSYSWNNNWQNVNTATAFRHWFSFSPRILIGTSNNLIASYNNTYTTYLSGFSINKVVKYNYASPIALVAGDSGLYIFDIGPPCAE